MHFRSKVEAMDQSADGQRNFDAFVVSAKGETSTKDFFNHETHEIHESRSRKRLFADVLSCWMMTADHLRSIASSSSGLVSLSCISWFPHFRAGIHIGPTGVEEGVH